MNRFAIAMASVVLVLPIGAIADGMMSEAPANAEAYFVRPNDGATVTSPFKVVFGLRHMGVAPAGMEKSGTGHHHLLINTGMPSEMGMPLPSSDQVRHFGGGQTETEIALPPGKHTLQLLLGNHMHVPHNNPVKSEKITITVE